jgi:hypothetical protein
LPNTDTAPLHCIGLMKSDEGWSVWVTTTVGPVVTERKQISMSNSRLEALAVLKREFVKELLLREEDMKGTR